jgi:hypothetical protein
MESSSNSDQNEGTPTSSVSSPYRRTYSDISGLSHRFDVQSFYNRPSNTNAVVLSGHEEDVSEDAEEPKDDVVNDVHGDGDEEDSDIDSAEDAVQS